MDVERPRRHPDTRDRDAEALSPDLLVEGDVALAGPAGTLRLLGRGTHLVLDATGVRWAPLVRMGFGCRGGFLSRLLGGAAVAHRAHA